MAIRKTRRQLVLDSAGIAAIYASGWGKAPAPVAAAPVAPTPPPSSVMAEIARLTALIVAAETDMPTAVLAEQERLADLLDCVERQCRFMADCMDGTMYKQLLRA